jgi:hypothetical protein
MDNTPAGQLTSNSSMLSSPKKHTNPIGLESTWSFGWQDNSQNTGNRPNTAKSNQFLTQPLPLTITKVVLSLETLKQNLKRRKPNLLISRGKKIQQMLHQFGIITPKMLERPLWFWVTKSLTIEKKTTFIR